MRAAWGTGQKRSLRPRLHRQRQDVDPRASTRRQLPQLILSLAWTPGPFRGMGCTCAKEPLGQATCWATSYTVWRDDIPPFVT